MSHDHHHGCGCGHDHPDTHPSAQPITLTENQKDFLHELGHRHALPVARFTIEDSRDESFIATALAPVFIRSVTDDMATVKEAGSFLQKLEELGMLTLDYDIPLSGYDYPEYKDSTLYAYFCETVTEGAKKQGFVGDTPALELGSMALTEAGEKIAAAHCGHSHHHHE